MSVILPKFEELNPNKLKYLDDKIIKYTGDEINLSIRPDFKYIGSEAFKNLAIENLMFSSSIKEIDFLAFANLKKLKAVYYDGKLEDWCNIKFLSAFSNPLCNLCKIYFMNELGEYYEPKEITIPDSILEIGPSQFEGFHCLEKIIISKNVKKISDSAFLRLNNTLKSLHILSSKTEFTYDTIYFLSSLDDFYVEPASKLVVLNDREQEVNDLLTAYKYEEACLLAKKYLNEDQENPRMWYQLFLSENKNFLDNEDYNNEVSFNNALKYANPLEKKEFEAEYNFYKLMNKIFERSSTMFRYAQLGKIQEFEDVFLKNVIILDDLSIEEWNIFNKGIDTILLSLDKPDKLDFFILGLNELYLHFNDSNIENALNKLLIKSMMLNSHLKCFEYVTPYVKSEYDDVRDTIKGIMTQSNILEQIVKDTYKYYYGELLKESKKDIFKIINNGDLEIEELIVPSSITEIKEGQFEGCINLRKITFEADSNLIKINKFAFKNCKSLEEIEFPLSLEKIDEGAFYNCNKLKKIILKNKISEISKEAFYNTAITDLYYDGDVDSYCKINIRLFKKDNLYFKINNEWQKCTDLIINTRFYPDSFSNVKSINRIEVNNVTVIPESAFRGTNASKIIINNAMIISNYAFNSSKVVELTLPAYIENIGSAFEYCNDLKTIYYLGDKKTFKQIDFYNKDVLKFVKKRIKFVK